MKIKFTIIDYIIIILVIVAIVFAFMHITSDNSAKTEKIAFDESTINKIPDTYLKYYKDGFITTATVEGFNASTGDRVTASGEVIWQDTTGGGDVKLLIKNNNTTYLTGLYRYVPDADIYIDHISLESNGEKYKNLVEIKVKPKEVTSLNDLIKGINQNCDFEISTKISIDSINGIDIQKINNKLTENGKRISIRVSANDNNNQLLITKANRQNINDVNSIIGNFDGISDDITIRIYNCSEKDINDIKNNYDVLNIRKF